MNTDLIEIKSNKSPIIICGMHRSGTSLIAQMLEACGLFLGNENQLLGPTIVDNPSGYWEFKDIVLFSERLLKSVGGSWKEISCLYSEFWISEDLKRKLLEAEDILEPLIQSGKVWGWKDPRATVMLPFWRHLFPNFKLIVCVRNPLEVAFSLSKRIGGHVDFHKGLKLWRDYYELLGGGIQNNDVIYVHYELMMAKPDSEIRRLCDFTDLSPSDKMINKAKERIKSDLYRGVVPDEQLFQFDELPYGIIEIYSHLCEGANNKFSEDSLDVNQRVQNYQLALEKLLKISTKSFDSYNLMLEKRKLQVDRLKQKLFEKEKEVLFYSMSKSWRITRPLRKLNKLIKGE